MRIAVIRNDIPFAISLSDLPTISQANVTTEPPGGVGSLRYPDFAKVDAFITGNIRAGVLGTGTVSPTTVSTPNRTLRLRASASDAYTVVTVATGSYMSGLALITAVATALEGTPFEAVPLLISGNAYRSIIRTRLPGKRVQVDSVANGSTLNTAIRIPSGGSTFTVPAASDFLHTMLNSSIALSNIGTALGAGATVAQGVTFQNMISQETPDTASAMLSLTSGSLRKFSDAGYNPDPSRKPPLASGAVLGIYDVNGGIGYASLPFLNAITTASDPAFLSVEAYGLDFGSEEDFFSVKFFTPTPLTLSRTAIEKAGGSLNYNILLIPYSILPGVGVDTQVQLIFASSFLSNVLSVI